MLFPIGIIVTVQLDVSLAIFDTHVKIWNNGSLPGGLKIEDLKHSHESIPRNELIAKVFHDRGLIE